MRRIFKHPRYRYAVPALVAAVALSLGGCASAVGEGSSSSSTPTPGGTLNIVQAADVNPLTLFSQNNPNLSINRTIFNYLVDYNHETLEPEPQLAESWSFSEDGTVLTFTLVAGVTFHDGRALTSADVAASIATVQRDDVPSQTKHIAKQIVSVETPSESEVVVTFAEPLSNAMDLFLMMPIIDGTQIDDLLAGKSFNGTGPFSVKEYSPGQGFELVKNENYWKEDLPYLDGVNVTVVRDSQSMLSSLKSGQSDLALDLAPLDASTLQSTTGFKVVESDANDSVMYIGSNVTVPMLSDKKVRQAISYAIDRDRILEQAFGGIGQVTSLPWAQSSPAFDGSKSDYFARDIDKSRQLLADAGVAGQSINIYYDAGFAPNVGTAEIVQYDLTEAGLKPNLQPLQASEFSTRLRSGGFDGLFLAGHGFGQLNPATLLKGAFPFNADSNASSFDSQEYKDLANAVWKSSDASSEEVLGSVNDFLLDQQFVSDLVLSTHTYSISDRVKDLDYTMLDYIDLDSTYLG